MMELFNNWYDDPFLNEGERLIRIHTGNAMDELYCIVDGDVDEGEIRGALRRMYGAHYHYDGWEDASYLCEHRPFQQYELDALLGEHAGDFDVEGIVADATEVGPDGNRYWAVGEDEMNDVLAANER